MSRSYMEPLEACKATLASALANFIPCAATRLPRKVDRERGKRREQLALPREFEDQAEQSLPRPCREMNGRPKRTYDHLIHRPARDIIPPLGGARFLLLHLILHSSQATATSRVHRNSVLSTHMRCMITANRRASGTARVACCNAVMTGVPVARMTSGASATNSAARRRSCSPSPG
jgi:hypothetical protein